MKLEASSSQCCIAIPTAYGGVAFRSRLEADAAYLFDQIGLGWEYEAHSFLLPSALHYRPDFLIKSRSLWAETRGYRTPEGDAQITGFAGWIHAGSPEPEAVAGLRPDFLVIGPRDVVLNEYEGKWGVTSAPALLMRCGSCGAFSFLAVGGDEGCKAQCTARPNSAPDRKWSLAFERGAILIDRTAFRAWLRGSLAEGILPLTKDRI